jgi:hypothetical protein
MLAILMADARVRAAALVARQFRLDPVALLDDDGDDWPMTVRVACARIVDDAERKANEKSTKGVKRPRRH